MYAGCSSYLTYISAFEKHHLSLVSSNELSIIGASKRADHRLFEQLLVSSYSPITEI